MSTETKVGPPTVPMQPLVPIATDIPDVYRIQTATGFEWTMATTGHGKAWADVFAAAPDLLAACEAALNDAKFCLDDACDSRDRVKTLREIRDGLQQAIAKARGTA